MLRPFKLHEPTSVHDAVSLLGRFGEEAKVYCGGTELLLAMKEGLLRYSHLVNIKTIPGLDEVGYDQGSGMLSIGATVTHTALEHSLQIQSRFPMIAEAEGNVANVRVRNVGTIGGNLCFSEPHSDPGAFLLLFDTQVEIQGSGGQRTIPLAELTLGPFETCLEDDEGTDQDTGAPVPARHDGRLPQVRLSCAAHPRRGSLGASGTKYVRWRTRRKGSRRRGPRYRGIGRPQGGASGRG